MAKKLQPLTSTDIILNADAETIQAALAARIEIDALLIEREKAYQQIAELEAKVDGILDEPGIYPYPAPPLPVAGFSVKGAPAAKKVAKKKVATPAEEDTKAVVEDDAAPESPDLANADDDEDDTVSDS